MPIESIGQDFVVNSTTTNGQYFPSIAALADGRFIVTWQSYDGSGIDTSGPGIRARLFNADGSEAGSDFVVNSTTTNSQIDPSVTALPDGRFVVTWYSNDAGGSDSSGFCIRARVYSADGSVAGNDFVVNSTTANHQLSSSVTGLPDGRFVVTWYSSDAGGSDTSGYCIRARLFNDDGSSAGNDFVVNSTTTNDQFNPSVTALPGGRFAVTWHSTDAAGSDSSGPCIRARLFNADGSHAADDFVVNSTVTLDQFNPSVTALTDGRFVVTWISNDADGSDTSGTSIRARLFNADGSDAGNDFVVNSTATHDQFNPSIAALADGRFAVTWLSDDASGSDTSGTSIRARLFNVDGSCAGDDFVVNSTTQGDQSDPSIAAMADGRFVVTWYSYDASGSDTDTTGIRAQVFDPTVFIGNPGDDTWHGGNFADHINGDAGNDTLFGLRGDDAINGGAGDDFLDGGAGDDTLSGLGGDDVINGGAGNDFLDGGAGNDTAVFSHGLSQYTLQDFGGRMRITGPDGTDTLTAIERLQFADTTLMPGADGSALFDRLFYLTRNTDVDFAAVSPLDHYNAFGSHEGRDPNPFFSTEGYLGANPDVAAAGLNPLDHFHQFGWKQGRDPSPFFDTKLYLLRNPDVAAAGIDPLEHFLAQGQAEGRQAFAAIGESIVTAFDAEFYLLSNPDVARAGVDPLQHYDRFGWKEGRDPNGFFDTSDYLAAYGDVAAAGIDPLWHYEQFGWKEGRDPSTSFDTQAYLAANLDVAAADINPLQHFLQSGIYEGRSSFGDGVFH